MSKSFQREAQKTWESGKAMLDAARGVRESYHTAADEYESDDILKDGRPKLETESEISDPVQSNSVEE